LTANDVVSEASFEIRENSNSHTTWRQFKTRRRKGSISEVGEEYLRTAGVILKGSDRYLRVERKMILRKALCQVLDMRSYWVQKREEECNRKIYTLRTCFTSYLFSALFFLTLLALHYTTLFNLHRLTLGW